MHTHTRTHIHTLGLTLPHDEMKGLEELTFDVPLYAPGPRSPAGVRWGCQGLSEAESVGGRRRVLSLVLLL